MAVLQMTWQPTQKRKSGPPLGLKNLGNTCYLNSVLQCLTYTPPLANFCLKSQHSSSCDSAAGAASEKKSECPFCILEKRIVRSLSLDCTLDTPSKINNCLKIFAQHFRYGRQEDAHEFLRYVIDSCHNTCLRLKKLQQQIRKGGGGGGADGNGNTIVKEIFGGALQSQIKCLSCGAESNKVDDIMDISLDVFHSSSLKDALEKFFQPEVLDGSNKYKCDNCKKLVTARKQLSILQAPNVLVIQLKRFEGIYGGKIDKPIAFEEVLVLSSYMCKASQDLHPEYNLFGTIVHSGFSPDSGHYYAYIKDAVGRWYCCNDSYVSLSTLQEVLSEKVYILFFSRTKQRSPPAKTCFPVIGSKPNNSNGLARSKNSTGQLEKPENGKQLSSHSHSNSNGLAKNSSGQLDKPENGKHVSSHPPDKENSMMSKVSKVHSSPVRDLSIFGKSSIKKAPTSGNIKIVLHPRESANGTGDVRASIPKEKEAASSRDRNGVSKSCRDGEMTNSHAIANGNEKIPSTATRSVDEGLHKDHGGSNGKAAASDHKEMTRSYSLANGNSKIPSVTTDSLGGSLHRSDGETNGKADARTSVVKDLSNDRVESSPISGSKRKSPYQCILLDQDARSREKMEEFKEELQKEASLVLRSCGWSEEVYASMRSKKRGSKAENEGSNYHDKKRLLIADAKATFISRIPETLKGSLIKRLRSFSQGNLPSSSSALRQDI